MMHRCVMAYLFLWPMMLLSLHNSATFCRGFQIGGGRSNGAVSPPPRLSASLPALRGRQRPTTMVVSSAATEEATATTSEAAAAVTDEQQQRQQQLEEAIPGVTAWECDDDLEQCVQVPACDELECRTSLDVRIHDKWYDLSGWRKAHPAGEHWIDWYDGRDATEVMDAFHSDKARKMYQKLPPSAKSTREALEETVAPDSPTQLAFRKLRDELEADGWWERDMKHEYTQLGLWALFVAGAVATAQSVPLLSTSCLAISMTAAGWLGHDYVHGVDPFADKLRNFAALAAGLHPTWWSDKVNITGGE